MRRSSRKEFLAILYYYTDSKNLSVCLVYSGILWLNKNLVAAIPRWALEGFANRQIVVK